MPERIDADACIVGAGYAGLTTHAYIEVTVLVERVQDLDRELSSYYKRVAPYCA